MIRAYSLVAITIAIAIVVTACGSGPEPSAPVVLTTVPPSGVVPGSPTVSSQELADALRFREEFGLRSDEGWILQVAGDPASDRAAFGVPLTAAEVLELDRRAAVIDEIKPLVVDYGLAHPQDYAGAYTDQRAAGRFVVQFSAHLAEHTAELQRRVRPGSPLEVRAVRWSLEDLEAFAARMDRERAWFATIPAILIGYGTDVEANRLNVQISSVDPDAVAKIEAHFGWTSQIVEVESDGTGALLLQSGLLEIVVRDPAGRPVEGLACVAVPDLDGAYEPRPVPIPTTNSRGVCRLRLPATGYWIRLETGQAPPTLVVTGRAIVQPDAETQVSLTAP